MDRTTAPSSQSRTLHTKLALLWMNLTSEPLVAIYSFIPFILRKELGATAFQLSLLAMLNPVLAVFSFYWGAQLSYRKNSLLPNLISAWILARIPFLFFPFIKTFWLFFGACAVYQLFQRASTPALMEILRRNLPEHSRRKIFSCYYLLSVLEGAFIGLLLANVLKIDENNWTYIFFAAGLLSLTSLFWQMRVTTPDDPEPHKERPHNRLTHPIKSCIQLLRDRPDFAHFQWGFMFGGLALMVIGPAKTIFFADKLHISIAHITLARCVFVSLGLAGSSLIWQLCLDRYGIQSITRVILLLFALFPLFILSAYWAPPLFFGAHFVYGIAQGGSHLVWHLSGPIFAQEQDSSLYTTVNILMVGLRGAIGPLLGGLLCDTLGSFPVLLFGATLAAFGALYMKKKTSMSKRQIISNP